MYGEKGYDNATSKEVIELTTGKRFGSACLAAEYFNLSFSHVCAVARGKRGSTGGYVFRYIKNNSIQLPEHSARIKSLQVRASIPQHFQQYI